MRIFISTEIPEKIKKEILKIQKQLPKFEGKLIEYENLHLTLKFLGEISEEKINEIKKRLSEIKFNSFESEINSIGFFDNRTSKIYPPRMIIWLGVKNCEKLQEEIDYKLEGLFEREKRFMGHLTIARVKSLENKGEFTKKLYEINIPKMEFYVDNFKLKESTLTEKGSIYKNIETYKLKYNQ